jgi:four helix bundle protein
LPNSSFNKEYISQLIRSSSSPGANYVEAIEAVSKKDFIHRLKICRKETKESIYWFDLLNNVNIDTKLLKENNKLVTEARELIRIFTAAIIISEKNLQIENRK